MHEFCLYMADNNSKPDFLIATNVIWNRSIKNVILIISFQANQESP